MTANYHYLEKRNLINRGLINIQSKRVLYTSSCIPSRYKHWYDFYFLTSVTLVFGVVVVADKRKGVSTPM